VIVVLPDKGEGWEPIPLPPVMEGVQADAFEAFIAFNKVVNSFEQLMVKDASEGGTQPSHVTCLRLLAMRDGICQRDIADALRISRARVTAIVQALEKAGAVRRERDGTDARRTRVYLTEAGREIDRQKGFIREARINEIFADMQAEDRVELIRRLDDLTRRLQAILHSNTPAARPGA
jgi:DNA-binding MarR family transcriptional regulator